MSKAYSGLIACKLSERGRYERILDFSNGAGDRLQVKESEVGSRGIHVPNRRDMGHPDFVVELAFEDLGARQSNFSVPKHSRCTICELIVPQLSRRAYDPQKYRRSGM